MAFTKTYFARFDSNSANNPALNLTGDPAIEITFVNEDINGNLGDLFLEQGAGGTADPDTVVSIGGVTYEFSLSVAGTLPTTKKSGAGQVPDQFEGANVYIITVYDYPVAGDTTRLAFMPDEQATAAEMDAFGNGAIDVQNANFTPPPSPVCFHRGTLIATPRGQVAVEELKVGDLVMTLDHGPRPVRWIASTRLDWPEADPAHKPILIEAGALGGGLPERDLMVSPQHRMLLSGEVVQEIAGVGEVLAPAKALAGVVPGVRRMEGRTSAEYFHLMLDSHAVLLAEGAGSESFYPGRMALRMLSPLQRRQVLRLFPALRGNPEGGYGPMARAALSVQRARAMVRTMRRAGVETLCKRENPAACEEAA